MQQVHLVSGNTHLTAWLDKDVRVGDRLSLKIDPELWWNVEWVGKQTTEQPNRGWKVGGLS